ncbi:hypothetical protein [Dankookia sp. P2]|uniref:hypothetical protein n=1 Tax=Dankookia sp. P2 TaxID=3423955 RepID=UPI003D674DE4
MIPMVQEGPAAQLAVAALADRIGPLLSHLPSLPRIVRYYDDFTDRWHTIHNYPTSRSLTITADGVNNVIDLSPFDHHVLHILRHALLHWFGRLDAKTIRTRLGSLLVDPSLANRAITTAASVSPADFRCAWIRWFDADAATQHGQWAALKQMLHSFCALSINEWTDEYEDFVRALPSPKVDIYAALRAGDCFIPVEHQGAVADYLDEMASIAKVSPATIDTELLRSICLLTLSFQHGVRPGQTARRQAGRRTISPDRCRPHPLCHDKAARQSSGFPHTACQA